MTYDTARTAQPDREPGYILRDAENCATSANAIRERLVMLLDRLRVAPPREVRGESGSMISKTPQALVNSVAQITDSQTATFKVLEEIEAII